MCSVPIDRLHAEQIGRKLPISITFIRAQPREPGLSHNKQHERALYLTIQGFVASIICISQ